jgi:hypothetical protein
VKEGKCGGSNYVLIITPAESILRRGDREQIK